MFPDVFVQSLERDNRFFIALDQLKTTCRAFCAYGALNDSFEYLKVCVNYLVRHTSIIDLERQFRHIDENNDRLISRQEFRDALKKPPYMLNLSSEALQKLLKRFDQDGDGNVDYGEFVQFVFDMETGSDGANSTNNNVNNNGKSIMQNEYDEKEDLIPGQSGELIKLPEYIDTNKKKNIIPDIDFQDDQECGIIEDNMKGENQ